MRFASIDIPFEAEVKVEDKIENVTVRKRARHVVSEIKRTEDAVKELRANNLVKFGELMNRSHDSLRDDYEVTGTELDTMVEEARKIDAVIGSRMTGGGFGGCTVSLVKDAAVIAPIFVSLLLVIPKIEAGSKMANAAILSIVKGLFLMIGFVTLVILVIMFFLKLREIKENEDDSTTYAN